MHATQANATVAFYISELAELIVEKATEESRAHAGSSHVGPLSPFIPSKWNDLKALGLTCKAFREPCMNRTWRTQVSLVPLLRALDAIQMLQAHSVPVPHLGFGICRKIPQAFHCTKSIQASDIPRLLEYSTRIRELDLTTYLSRESASFLENVPSAMLFPQLRAFRCGVHLQHPAEVLLVLRTMGDVVVNLATTIIPGVPGTTPMDTVTHKSLPHNYSVLFFPSLRQAIPSSHTSFATLTEFSLGVPSFTAALDILQHSRFPSIRSLTCNIHTPDAPTLSQASALLIAVVDACNAETLSSLAIGYCSEDPNEYPDQMMAYLRSEALRPLLRFSAMSSLRLLGRWSWDLDDDLIGDMARAWPELRKLHLDPDGYLSSVHRVTYRCLELVATHCPNLEAFGSVINTASSTDIDSDQLAGSGPQNTTLRRLHFGDSLIESEHVEPMAAYLTRLFPSLESITTLAPRWRSPDEVDDMERWSAVAKKMSVKYISD